LETSAAPASAETMADAISAGSSRAWRKSRWAPRSRHAASAVSKATLSPSLPVAGTRTVFIFYLTPQVFGHKFGAGDAARLDMAQTEPCLFASAAGCVLREDALQGAPVHLEAPRRLGDVAVALLEDALDVLPAHPVGRHRIGGGRRQPAISGE